MIGIPSLFAKNDRLRRLEPIMLPLSPAVVKDWVAMEMMPGADVRVTVRNHTPVRLEVIQKPNEDQRKAGISQPWYVDTTAQAGPGYWLWEAVKGTDFSVVPDGEWEADAIGENIAKNTLDIEGHRLVFSSLFGWQNLYPQVEVPPTLGRTPVNFEDLRYWLATTPSSFVGSRHEGIPMEGVVWWHGGAPVAQIRAKEFPPLVRAPNPEAELPELLERDTELVLIEEEMP